MCVCVPCSPQSSGGVCVVCVLCLCCVVVVMVMVMVSGVGVVHWARYAGPLASHLPHSFPPTIHTYSARTLPLGPPPASS